MKKQHGMTVSTAVIRCFNYISKPTETYVATEVYHSSVFHGMSTVSIFFLCSSHVRWSCQMDFSCSYMAPLSIVLKQCGEENTPIPLKEDSRMIAANQQTKHQPPQRGVRYVKLWSSHSKSTVIRGPRNSDKMSAADARCWEVNRPSAHVFSWLVLGSTKQNFLHSTMSTFAQPHTWSNECNHHVHTVWCVTMTPHKNMYTLYTSISHSDYAFFFPILLSSEHTSDSIIMDG